MVMESRDIIASSTRYENYLAFIRFPENQTDSFLAMDIGTRSTTALFMVYDHLTSGSIFRSQAV
jgi:hypothetical protein